MLESRTSKRARFIEYIYKFELMDDVFSHSEAAENNIFSEQEIKMIQSLEKNYDKYRKLISSYLSANWNWSRISPLERAILVFGAFELGFAEKKIVINELVSYTKGFVPGDNYKFINAVLDKIGVYYEQIRANKKTA